jgi:hypothetical protein
VRVLDKWAGIADPSPYDHQSVLKGFSRCALLGMQLLFARQLWGAGAGEAWCLFKVHPITRCISGGVARRPARLSACRLVRVAAVVSGCAAVPDWNQAEESRATL